MPHHGLTPCAWTLAYLLRPLSFIKVSPARLRLRPIVLVHVPRVTEDALSRGWGVGPSAARHTCVLPVHTCMVFQAWPSGWLLSFPRQPSRACRGARPRPGVSLDGVSKLPGRSYFHAAPGHKHTAHANYFEATLPSQCAVCADIAILLPVTCCRVVTTIVDACIPLHWFSHSPTGMRLENAAPGRKVGVALQRDWVCRALIKTGTQRCLCFSTSVTGYLGLSTLFSSSL